MRDGSVKVGTLAAETSYARMRLSRCGEASDLVVFGVVALFAAEHVVCRYVHQLQPVPRAQLRHIRWNPQNE
eukprot:3565958-Rhodomonas_salina.7